MTRQMTRQPILVDFWITCADEGAHHATHNVMAAGVSGARRAVPMPKLYEDRQEFFHMVRLLGSYRLQPVAFVKWRRSGPGFFSPRRAPGWMAVLGEDSRWQQHPMQNYVLACEVPR